MDDKQTNEHQICVCMHCSLPIQQNQKFCGFCGKSCLVKRIKYCVECGMEIPDGQRFCNECGLDTMAVNKIGKSSPVFQEPEVEHREENCEADPFVQSLQVETAEYSCLPAEQISEELNDDIQVKMTNYGGAGVDKDKSYELPQPKADMISRQRQQNNEPKSASAMVVDKDRVKLKRRLLFSSIIMMSTCALIFIFYVLGDGIFFDGDLDEAIIPVIAVLAIFSVVFFIVSLFISKKKLIVEDANAGGSYSDFNKRDSASGNFNMLNATDNGNKTISEKGVSRAAKKNFGAAFIRLIFLVIGLFIIVTNTAEGLELPDCLPIVILFVGLVLFGIIIAPKASKSKFKFIRSVLVFIAYAWAATIGYELITTLSKPEEQTVLIGWLICSIPPILFLLFSRDFKQERMKAKEQRRGSEFIVRLLLWVMFWAMNLVFPILLGPALNFINIILLIISAFSVRHNHEALSIGEMNKLENNKPVNYGIIEYRSGDEFWVSVHGKEPRVTDNALTTIAYYGDLGYQYLGMERFDYNRGDIHNIRMSAGGFKVTLPYEVAEVENDPSGKFNKGDIVRSTTGSFEAGWNSVMDSGNPYVKIILHFST